MANIFPFKAVRPRNGDTDCFELLFKEEYIAAGSSPEIIDAPVSKTSSRPKKSGIQHGKTFGHLYTKYCLFKDQETLIPDAKPSVYIHRITKKKITFTGIIIATSIDDYNSNVIKKHEDTILPRVEFFKKYLAQARFNTEPVLLTYPDDHQSNKWISTKTSTAPDYQFDTVGHDNHELWKVDDPAQIIELQKIFSKIPNLYIADGHHRCASFSLLSKEEDKENANYFMSFVIPESQLNIYGFDWMIKGLNDHSVSEYLQLVENGFDIEKLNVLKRPTQEGKIVMYLAGTAYLLTLKQKHQEKLLDVQVLLSYILEPVLGIYDIRNDRRISYFPGKGKAKKTQTLVDNQVHDVAFFLCPPKFSQIKKVADEGLTMPPKSTYIEPKFRNALLVYEL
ncbi:MAG TPA: DUF1015 domain-containing protein [Flavobacterium sp.]|jgi:uncharacterized protein (DUF1015 family)